MNMNYQVVMAIPLNWVLNFLSNNSSFRLNHGREGKEETGMVRYAPKVKNEEAVECAVCLCTIAEGDEIKELRCDHIFHRVCLERWFGYGRETCPLCRSSINSCMKKAESGENLICFSFCSSSSGNQKPSWWLR